MKMRTIDRKFCMAVVASLCIVAALPALSASKAQQQDSQTPAKQTVERDASPETTNAGEKKFKQNCSRCHEAPQSFSPRISGSIVRHMRVRASLSEKDAREILRFLNPQ